MVPCKLFLPKERTSTAPGVLLPAAQSPCVPDTQQRSARTARCAEPRADGGRTRTREASGRRCRVRRAEWAPPAFRSRPPRTGAEAMRSAGIDDPDAPSLPRSCTNRFYFKII